MKRITCIIDNAVQRGSPLWGEHGLSFCIETDEGRLLFDTGRSESVLWHNLGLLGGCPRNASALVLSHAHIDHTGALLTLLSHRPGLPLHASPKLFQPRFANQEGTYKPIGMPLTHEEVSQLADLRLSQTHTEVLPGVWTSGEIIERPEPEGRSTRHVTRVGDDWQPDTYSDDMSLVIEFPEGLVVICGCCHAGLLNTLGHVKRVFQRPILAVLGGTHLVEADESQLRRVIDVLSNEYSSPRLYLNHCTGERAYVALASAFGDLVNPCPAGTIIAFD